MNLDLIKMKCINKRMSSPSDMFPSDQELNSKIQKSTNWLKWREVPENKWYKIIDKEVRETEYGESLILTLEDRNQNTVITYTTAIIKKELDSRAECNFIKSTGKPKNQRYFGFELVCHK